MNLAGRDWMNPFIRPTLGFGRVSGCFFHFDDVSVHQDCNRLQSQIRFRHVKIAVVVANFSPRILDQIILGGRFDHALCL